jgi:hypothetical protein
VLVLGLTVALGAGAVGSSSRVPADQARAVDGVGVRAIARGPAAGAWTADAARWTGRAEAEVDRAAERARAVAGAALVGATGVDALRVAPEPMPGLADLDAAVRELRGAQAVLAHGGTVLPVARSVIATDPGTPTPPAPTPPPSSSAGGPAARLSAALDVRDAAAVVFRLTLEVERGAPRPATEVLGVPAEPLAALAALEQTVADARAQAQSVRAGGLLAGGGAVARSGRVTSGPLRTDGTVDPAGLCPVPFASGALLRCDAVDALVALNAVFRAEHGTDLPVGGTYRTYDEQVRLKAAKGGLAAAPGTSHHGWGVAVDFSGFGGVGQFDHPLYLWMAEHAPAFGWIHPAAMGPGGSGPHEPWHWEFAGTPPTGAAEAR